MLDQTAHWMEAIATVVEGLLLLRILALRLHRVYLFVTLYAIVNLLVDTSALAAGVDSDAGARIFFYSRFLFAVLYPLAAWDVFEEINAQVSKFRRLHAPRLVSGLFITALLGFICSIGIDDQDLKGTSSSADFIGLFLWLGAASSSLLFTWNVLGAARKQNIAVPGNTSVWAIFFIITFGKAVVDCGFDVAGGLLPHSAFAIANIVLVLFDMCLGTWCLAKIRALPSNVTPATEKAHS